jgi:hypothetical protein
MFVARTFKGGRQLENVLEQTIAKMNEPKPPKQQGPSPEEVKMQGQVQLETMRIQANQQAEAQNAQLHLATERMRLQMEDAAEQRRMEREVMMDQMRMNQEAMLTRFTELLRAETEINKAQISANATVTAAQDSAAEAAVMQGAQNV